MKIDKRACLERAKRLINEEDPICLIYAALELRMCMEDITYEKLRVSARHIPEEIINTWQPPQAVRALLEYEPDTDKSFLLFAGIEEEYGKPSTDMKFVGEHKPFKMAWLRKHYNKVGSYLHFPKNSVNITELKDYLESVIKDTEEVIKGNILGGWIDEGYDFECIHCHKTVFCGKQRLLRSKEVICLNPNCGAEYFAINDNDQVYFKLKTIEFKCINCDTIISIENRKVEAGLTFKCPSCSLAHKIVGREWAYGIEKEIAER